MRLCAPLGAKTCALFPAMVCLIAWSSLAEDLSPPSEVGNYDCGTLALHSLLAIEGRSIPVDELRSRLPALGQQGHSMADLRNAARAAGVELVGVMLGRGDRAPDRPALVFLQRDEHGHFAVVRPVGHSGKLIQIIDATGDPIVMDASDLYASRQWTGIALIPLRPNWTFRVLAGVLTASCSILLALLFARRFYAAPATGLTPGVPFILRLKSWRPGRPPSSRKQNLGPNQS